MTVPSEVDVVVTPGPAANDDRSYVDWPAIIAGIVLATAISVLLLTFGSAIGLGLTNFNAADDVPAIWIAIAAATWLLWVQISSFMAGGYITGRLRRRHGDATEDESDVRDGAHGLLVWGGALVVGAVIAVSGLGAAATAVGNIAGAVTNAASNVAGGAAEGGDPTAYFTDMLFRPAPTTAPVEDVAPATETPAATTEAPAATTTEGPAATAPAPAATAETPAATPAAPAATEAPAATTTETPAATTTAPAAPATTAPSAAPASATPTSSADTTAVRAEAGRIFAQSAISGDLNAEDKAYLVQVVSTNTGLSEAEAQARVDQVVTAIDNAKAQAAEVAEEARKMTVLGAFLTAASLLVSAVGAYWAAQKGGNHRDKNIAFPGVFRRW